MDSLTSRTMYFPAMSEFAFILAGTSISGGTSVILYYAKELARAGHNVTLATLASTFDQPTWHPGWESIASGAVRLVNLDQAADRDYDYVFATYWETAFHAWRLRSERYMYLVQSIESRFVPPSNAAKRFIVDATYELGLVPVVIARWLKNYLESVHELRPILVPNGIDKRLFTQRSSEPQTFRMLVEGAVNATFKNVPEAVRTCAAAGVGQVWLLTPSRIRSFPGVDEVFSQIPLASVGSIYSQCDVLVKLSSVEGMFTPPLEMFHTGGTAIVSNVTGHDEYVVHGENGLVSPLGQFDDVRDWLQLLARNPAVLAKLKAGATTTARDWPDWPSSINMLLDSLSSYTYPSFDRNDLKRRSQRLRALLMSIDGFRGHDSELQAVLNSSSWRITKPLRDLALASRKVRNQVEEVTRRLRRWVSA